tara:strand:+ start:7256 stop:7531 length:276 start_codon:yes stop_codon:yes gene_type:complete
MFVLWLAGRQTSCDAPQFNVVLSQCCKIGVVWRKGKHVMPADQLDADAKFLQQHHSLRPDGPPRARITTAVDVNMRDFIGLYVMDLGDKLN